MWTRLGNWYVQLEKFNRKLRWTNNKKDLTSDLEIKTFLISSQFPSA